MLAKTGAMFTFEIFVEQDAWLWKQAVTYKPIAFFVVCLFFFPNE